MGGNRPVVKFWSSGRVAAAITRSPASRPATAEGTREGARPLFAPPCGAGDLGYAQAGFRFDVLAEIDKRRLPVAALNHPAAATVLGDLRKT